MVMVFTAVVMGVSGIALSFFPLEILRYAIGDPVAAYPLIMQLLGSLYFAFAMLNWTAKENLLGGIYGRSVIIGNLTHFVVGALALIKGSLMLHSPFVWIIAAVYSFFAVLFGMIFFRHPAPQKNNHANQK
jgi:hypothetical protein